jgi:hypothetical protein
MKSISKKTCLECSELFTDIPLLICGHFICNECYCKLKSNRPNKNSNKCGCPICGKNMIRKCKISL